MGTPVDLYEGKYLYQLPPVPSEKEIIGYDIRKKSEQYWRTPTFPEQFTWSMMTKREQYEIVTLERDRFENGVWFMNNGEPTYITGMHYDHLVNATFDFGKCFYADSQRLDFYFRDYVYKDPRCFGQCTIKPRRYGYSLQEVTQQTYESLRAGSRKLGMMSNNKEKTYETLFDILVQSYIERPEWVRPDIYMPNDRIPKTELWWNSGRVKKVKDSFSFDSTGNLNSRIIPKPTTVIGYDGNKLHYLTLDEVWKWTLANPYDCWKKQRPCLVVGTTIVGKCSMLSTMGDDDDYEESIDAGIKMFFDSDPTDRNENGHTKSGLYHRFIPGEYALFDKYMDKHGFINMDAAGTHIENERKQYPEGSKDWIYLVRKYPRTLAEATSTATGIGIFNNQRIDAAITIMKTRPPETTIGRLEQLPNKKIIFEPDNQKGVWEFAVWPKINDKVDTSNRWYQDQFDGTYHLMGNPQGCLGYDPVRYAVMDTTSQSLSMAAIVGYQKYDYYGNLGAGMINCLYHQRPDDAEIAHHECFKASLFTGFPIAVERQVESMKRRMQDIYALALLLHSHYDGKIGFWSTKSSIKDEIDLIVKYWKIPLTTFEIDYLMKCRFPVILEQAKKFNTTQITKFDIIVALMKALSGALQIKETLESDNYQENLNRVFNIIQPQREWNTHNQRDQQTLAMGHRLERES